jgi:hypothetical protein
MTLVREWIRMQVVLRFPPSLVRLVSVVRLLSVLRLLSEWSL